MKILKVTENVQMIQSLCLICMRPLAFVTLTVNYYAAPRWAFSIREGAWGNGCSSAAVHLQLFCKVLKGIKEVGCVERLIVLHGCVPLSHCAVA